MTSEVSLGMDSTEGRRDETRKKEKKEGGATERGLVLAEIGIRQKN